MAFGFTRSQAEHYMFTKQCGHDFLALLIYVDDILLLSSNNKLVSKTKEYLHSLFTIKDLGLAKYFLGIEVAQTKAGTYLS